MQPEPALGIVADDLTGANDTLVQFAGAGFRARLSLGSPRSSDRASVGPMAVATVTDARPVDDSEARARTGEATGQLMSERITHLYVKIDSTMRGSVAGQIAGALEAWAGTRPEPFAVVCPAYPAMGRTVHHGALLVDGRPVELSPAGTDPVTPVHTSVMADLLPGAITLPPQASTAAITECTQKLLSAAKESAVVVVDAVTESDLDVLAAALLEIGPRAVPVGSAGLAAAFARQWITPALPAATAQEKVHGRTLIIVSSLHDVSRAQSEMLVGSLPTQELLTLRPALADLRTPAEAEAWLSAAVPPGELPSTVMVVSPSRTGLPSDPSDGARPEGATIGTAVANGLASLTTALMDDHGVADLVLLGGDGARAVLRACGTESVTVKGAVQEGVPFGVINGGRADGVRVVTKAGGFGKPGTLVDILDTLTKNNPHPTEASS